MIRRARVTHRRKGIHRINTTKGRPGGCFSCPGRGPGSGEDGLVVDRERVLGGDALRQAHDLEVQLGLFTGDLGGGAKAADRSQARRGAELWLPWCPPPCGRSRCVDPPRQPVPEVFGLRVQMRRTGSARAAVELELSAGLAREGESCSRFESALQVPRDDAGAPSAPRSSKRRGPVSLTVIRPSRSVSWARRLAEVAARGDAGLLHRAAGASRRRGETRVGDGGSRRAGSWGRSGKKKRVVVVELSARLVDDGDRGVHESGDTMMEAVMEEWGAGSPRRLRTRETIVG